MFALGSTIATVMLSAFVILAIQGVAVGVRHPVQFLAVFLMLGGAVGAILFPWAWLVSFLTWKGFQKLWQGFSETLFGLGAFGLMAGFVSLVGPSASLAKDEGADGMAMMGIMLGSGCLVGAVFAPILFGARVG